MTWQATILAKFPGGSSNKRLRQLTNEQGAAGALDTTVLDGAIDSALGDFARIVGLAADETRGEEVALIVRGVLYHLELLKGGDGKTIDRHERDFRMALEAYRKRASSKPRTDSPLTRSSERAGAMPDMDRKGIAGRAVTGRRGTPGVNALSPDD